MNTGSESIEFLTGAAAERREAAEAQWWREQQQRAAQPLRERTLLIPASGRPVIFIPKKTTRMK
jgi:hypothetical protein